MPYVIASARIQGNLLSVMSNITKTISQTLNMPSASTTIHRRVRARNLTIKLYRSGASSLVCVVVPARFLNNRFALAASIKLQTQYDSNYDHERERTNVRFGSKADMYSALSDVR